MDAQIIKFDREHVGPILDGEKLMTMRPAREGRPAMAGDLLILAVPAEQAPDGKSSDAVPFAVARARRVGKINAEAVPEVNFTGHEDYESVAELREEMADYYEYGINGSTDIFLVWFETYTDLTTTP